MQDILPLLGIFAVFSPALVLPGPDFIAVVRNTIRGGRRAGVLTALGVSLGIAFYAGLSAAGLATLLNRLEWFGVIVRLGGVGFLSFLGIQLLRTRRTPPLALERETPPVMQGPKNPVLMGLSVNLTNPKAIVFFASIFGTAIQPNTAPWVLAAIVAIVGGCGLIWFAMVSVLTASTRLLVSLEDHQHWIERLAGVAFLVFAGKILFDMAQQ